MNDSPDYWTGYRSALQDLTVVLTGWTETADVEALSQLVQSRLDAIDPPSEDPVLGETLSTFRAYDPHGGHGKDGRFEVATSYTALGVDGRVHLMKAGLLGDNFEPDAAEAFGRHLVRVAATARLPSEV